MLRLAELCRLVCTCKEPCAWLRWRLAAQACGERVVFDAVMVWAGYGAPVRDADSVCRPMPDVELVLPLIRFPLMSDEELQVGQPGKGYT